MKKQSSGCIRQHVTAAHTANADKSSMLRQLGHAAIVTCVMMLMNWTKRMMNPAKCAACTTNIATCIAGETWSMGSKTEFACAQLHIDNCLYACAETGFCIISAHEVKAQNDFSACVHVWHKLGLYPLRLQTNQFADGGYMRCRNQVRWITRFCFTWFKACLRVRITVFALSSILLNSLVLNVSFAIALLTSSNVTHESRTVSSQDRLRASWVAEELALEAPALAAPALDAAALDAPTKSTTFVLLSFKHPCLGSMPWRQFAGRQIMSHSMTNEWGVWVKSALCCALCYALLKRVWSTIIRPIFGLHTHDTEAVHACIDFRLQGAQGGAYLALQ